VKDDFSADLEHEHRLIDAGLDACLTADHRPLADRCADLARALQTLRRHIYFEEACLFPPLRALGLAGPLAVMVREHAVMWDTIANLEATLDDPSGVSIGICRDLRNQLAKHNGKEEAIVYTQARQLLPDADQAELGALVRTVTMPVDWTREAAAVR
jgi:hemerythrin-like domain-containing protein